MLYSVDPVMWKMFIKGLYTVTNEVMIDFQADKIICNAVDTSNVSMINSVLIPDEAKDIVPVRLQVDVRRMKDLPLKDSEEVSITYEDGRLQALAGKVAYNIPLYVDAAVKKCGGVTNTFPLAFNISADNLAVGIDAVNAAKDDKDTSYAVRFEYDGTSLVLTDREKDRVTVTYDPEDITIVDDLHDISSSMYTMDMMLPYVRHLKIYNTIQVRTGTNLPIAMVGSAPKLKQGFFVAPRIEHD